MTEFQRTQCSELCTRFHPALEKNKAPRMNRSTEKARQRRPDNDTNAEPRVIPRVTNHKDKQKQKESPRKLAMAIRGARSPDMDACNAIYNHYVKNTIFTKSNTEIPTETWEVRRAVAETQGLPFLVAVTRSNNRKSWGLADKSLPDQILGFAIALPWGSDTEDALHGVVNASVYVDPKKQQSGVGKTLLDRLLMILDPFYRSQVSHHFEYNGAQDNVNYDLAYNRNQGNTRKVVIEVLFQSKDSAEHVWRRALLEQRFGFQQVAFFLSLGDRNGEPVNLASFMRESFNSSGSGSSRCPM